MKCPHCGRWNRASLPRCFYCGETLTEAEDAARQEEQRRKDEAVRDAKREMWMRGVEEKLELHNGYAQKLGEIQTDIAVIKNDIKTLYKQA